MRVDLATEDAPGVNACVGRLEAEPDAASQCLNTVGGVASVSAWRCARLGRQRLIERVGRLMYRATAASSPLRCASGCCDAALLVDALEQLPV